MAKVEDVERRLLNWARWRIGGGSGGLGYASATLGMESGGSKYREAVIPTRSGEAIETDSAVQMLATELRVLVHGHYADGLSMAALAVKHGCSVATVYLRLGRVHQLLDQAFRDMAEARRVERHRVEELGRQARPQGGF